MLKEGDSVSHLPELKKYLGRYLILYFYPKDDTPGCTREACAFRDFHKEYADLNAVIVGVSKDSGGSHEKFIQKYGLPFELLSDPEFKLMTEFGAFGEKKLYGKTALGVIRSTFLISPEGEIVKAWKSVKVDGHVEKVLETLKKLTA